MADLIVGAWSWGSKYGPEYVERLRAGVARNLAVPYQFRVFSPEPEDASLTEIKGCFCRLRAFDPEWQARQGITGKLLILDLDLVVTGDLTDIVERPEPFVILQGVNASNPCPMNGSVWMLQAGYRPDVWGDFSLEAARAVPFDSFPDDQAWFAARMPDAAAYTDADGVYAFQKRGWPRGEALPKNARIVAFPGWRDPVGFQSLSWVKQHWLGEPVL